MRIPKSIVFSAIAVKLSRTFFRFVLRILYKFQRKKVTYFSANKSNYFNWFNLLSDAITI